MSKHETLKSAMLGERLKKEMSIKGMSLNELSERVKIHQPSLSKVLNWRVCSTETYFERIWKGIWLTDTQLKQIFQEIDRESFIYKYWRDILNQKEFSYKELFEIMKEEEEFSEKQIIAIEEFINFQKWK